MRRHARLISKCVLLVCVSGIVLGASSANGVSAKSFPAGPALDLEGEPIAVVGGEFVTFTEPEVDGQTLKITDPAKLSFYSASGRRVARIAIPDAVEPIAFSPGVVWMAVYPTFHRDRMVLAKLDRKTGRVLGTFDPRVVDRALNSVDDVVVTSDGIWASVSDDDLEVASAVVRLDSSSVSPLAHVSLPEETYSLTVRSDRVWAANDAGVLFGIDPATSTVTSQTRLGDWQEGLVGIAADADFVWVASTRHVVQVSPTSTTVAATFPLQQVLGGHDFLEDMAVDRGVVWLTSARKLHDDSDPPDHVWLFAYDARQARLQARYDVPRAGSDLSYPELFSGGGQVWVSLAGHAQRIAP